MSYRFLPIIALLALSLVMLAAPAFCEEATSTPAQIEQLIKQLGSPSYTEREQAEAKLLEFHMEAFEPLIQAREHKDPEIAARARYLVRQIQVHLVTPTDSPRVASLMRNIFALDRQRQETRIAELAILPNGEGLPALSRLIRFAESEISAKTAAMGIIQSRLYSEQDIAKLASQPTSRTGYPTISYSSNLQRAIQSSSFLSSRMQELGNAEPVDENLGKPLGKPLGKKERDDVRRYLKSCKRPAAELVLAWFDFADAKTEAEKKKVYEQWDKLCQQEEKQLANPMATITPTIFAFLLKNQLEKSVELNLGEEVQVELIRRQLKRTHLWSRGNYREIIERLIDEKVWKSAGITVPEFGSVMIRAYNRDIFPRFFCLLMKANQDDPQKLKLGDELFSLYEKSFQSHGTAKAAFHLQSAMVFVEEGFEEQAIQQYKKTLDIEDLKKSRTPERLLCWHCYQGMIDLYEGLEQFELAAKTCDEMLKKQESLTEKQKKRPAVADAMKRTKSHAIYYRAMAEKKKGNHAAYRELLKKALNLDPESGRILIECYNVPVTPNGKAFRDRLIKLIHVATASLIKRSKSGSDRDTTANWAAWLVANTEGDIDTVIKLLESVPSRHSNRNAGMLDTLALCYFKKGDLDRAVSLQRQATQQTPNDPRIQKAWKMIAEAYEKKTGKKPEEPKVGTARFRMLIGL